MSKWSKKSTLIPNKCFDQPEIQKEQREVDRLSPYQVQFVASMC